LAEYSSCAWLLNPEICPHVVKYIREIEDDIKTKFTISKDSHMAELWRIREEAKQKNQTLVRLRAEELRGKLMGYYVEKKQQLNVNKTLDDMSEEELENRMNQIHKQYSHFIDLKEPEKKIINAEIRGDQKAEKYKKGFDLATKLLRENGIKIDDDMVVEKRIELLRSISKEPELTEEQAKTQKALDDYQIRRKKERNNGKG